ncbi:AAA family ATPase [Polyangium mundeleinium]|uniref:AAA family ATPase n=1 Tax=Polyangium mundeleinium TaxID=2995306 RepID=A0ABT5ESK1_9BACT|nr:ATP-binding protein [Polyangium mundeleinium]MDC0744459.1 AAA family ATPase [Polyangium mundeleinium]
MITSVRLQNFKAHRDTTVELGRFTVLVGPNGSGKTSVLEALLRTSGLLNKAPNQAFRWPYDPDDIASRNAPDGPIGVELNSADSVLAIEWVRMRDRGPAIDWVPALRWEIQGTESGTGEARDKQIDRSVAMALAHIMGDSAIYHFDATRIASPAQSEHERPSVASDGSNTADVLASMKLEQEERFRRIEGELRSVVPNVERVRIRRAKAANATIGHQILLDFRGAPGVPAHAASEGTLVTLALLTVLHSPNSPRLILLDDIDQSLHPRAQIELVRQIKRLLDEMPDLQVVATTHSPYILDELDPKDVHVFALKNDGTVAHKRLSEHPEAASGVLTSGQIWSLDPEEEWVAAEEKT